ncbi:uncharacterized protein LOC132715095 [Ruditapes philippinarum]|uniref:uncharacterized protein LOC132715095 n=1 Tax=Ruditapes philippinarum TaxID=129788 RepID=UPI00295B99E4|nr:uncharacterized protein LOC132715095 [Ruditapes philippinarum]
MNPLAVTQRERIRQHNEQEDQEMQERTNETKTEDVHVEVDKHPEKEKRVYFLPKCFCLLIAVLALIAAVVVVVYYFRDKTSVDDLRGNVTHDKKPIEECHGISVELGDTIVIKCSFLEIITEEVVAIYKNVAGAKTSDFQCLKSVDEKNVTCTANNVTTCSSDGKVELRFLDKKKVKFTKTVRVNVIVPSSSLTTSLRQIFVGNNSNFFNLTCEYTQDCSNHVIKFLGEGKDIAGTRTCTTTYSNKDGYSIKCNAIISGKVFF